MIKYQDNTDKKEYKMPQKYEAREKLFYTII